MTRRREDRNDFKLARCYYCVVIVIIIIIVWAVGGSKLWERFARRPRPKQRTARGPPLAFATPTSLFSRAIRGLWSKYHIITGGGCVHLIKPDPYTVHDDRCDIRHLLHCITMIYKHEDADDEEGSPPSFSTDAGIGMKRVIKTIKCTYIRDDAAGVKKKKTRYRSDNRKSLSTRSVVNAE